MPTPLGHACAGLTVHVLAARGREDLTSRSRAVLIVGAAVAPDLDLLLRWIDGRNHHQGASHTLAAALVAGGLGALLAGWLGWRRAWLAGIATGLAWTSHVMLDYLGKDTNPPVGVPALWPWDRGYYKFRWPVFMEIGRTLDVATLTHDAVAAAWELTLLLPVLWLAWRVRSGRSRFSTP